MNEVLVTDDWSKKIIKSHYKNAVDALTYLINTCSECDGAYVGDDVKVFLDEMYSMVGGQPNE